MNTLSTLSRHQHPPQTVYFDSSRPVRRVNLLDRFALHLGVALIKWGRRPLAVETNERRAQRFEQHLARLSREHDAQAMLLLTSPPR